MSNSERVPNRSMCPLCKEWVNILPTPTAFHEDLHGFDCERCGRYLIEGGLKYVAEKSTIFNLKPDLHKYKGKEYILSGVTRNAHENGKVIKITYERIPYLIDSTITPTTPFELLDQVLLYVSKKAAEFNSPVKIDSDHDYTLFYAKSRDELRFVLREQNIHKYLCSSDKKFHLTLEGWERADELKRKKPDSKKAFVAMWFNEERMGSVYEDAFKPALEETGYDPYLVKNDRSNNDMIDNKIIAEIRKSRLLVADLTGTRKSVIFEAGLAMGLGIAVIWTCSEECVEWMKKNGKEFPFYIRQYPRIQWRSYDHLKKELKASIEAKGLNI